MSPWGGKLATTITPSSPEKTPSNSNNAGSSSYEEHILGVWRVVIMKDSYLSMFSFRWKNFLSIFPLRLRIGLVKKLGHRETVTSDLQGHNNHALDLLCRGLYDAYIISPRLFALQTISHVWFAIEGPLSLYFTNNTFFFIEKRHSGGLEGQASELYFAVMARVACVVFSACVSWASQEIRNVYSSRIKYEYEARLFSANLAADLPTSQDSEPATSSAEYGDVYEHLLHGVMVVQHTVSFILHLPLVANVIGNGLNDRGPVFVALCLLPPVMRQFKSDNLWTKAYVVSPMNEFYIRKSALGKLARPGLKQDVIAGGVNKYLLNALQHISEYHKAKDALRDTPDTAPEILYHRTSEVLSDLIMKLSVEGPTLYFAFMALFNPSKLSIVQLAILNETASSLCSTFRSIGMSVDYWPTTFSAFRNVYATLDMKNKMQDGGIPFPRPGYEASAGMRIEARNVSFLYPNSKGERAALSGISFTIQPGQLVVIVGANGCGKSTIIKLLGRFYDATSGRILIDGIPIEEYRMDELRKGIATLTQEHQLFPLSIEENIRLGSSEAEVMDDPAMIRESAVAAGAEALVENFLNGYDTVLEPVRNGYVSIAGQGNKELEAMHQKLEKSTSISGGEKQKLLAARTFLRLFTSPAKLVTVDEPSSALDPISEYQLFTKLCQERKGRTMIFVTHRFGHLTKHADLIICMKEGAIVEIGTHADLLLNGGEYAELYNIQARAFTTA